MRTRAVSYNDVTGALSEAYLAMWSALNCFIPENQRLEPAEFGSLDVRVTAAEKAFRRAEELLKTSHGDRPQPTRKSDLRELVPVVVEG